MTAVQDAVAAFEDLVEQAEASSEHRPRADLATYQLQALATTLAQLAGGPDAELPSEVAGALAAVQGWLSEVGAGLDEDEGRRLREKVGAYAVVAEDLGLERAHLEELAARWDAATVRAPQPGARASRQQRDPAAPAGELQACPVCGERFKRVAKHLSSAHPDEWRRRRG